MAFASVPLLQGADSTPRGGGWVMGGGVVVGCVVVGGGEWGAVGCVVGGG